MIVSWVRLLDGRFRDPLVGRDVLLGLLAGTVDALINRCMVIGPGWVGLPSVRPDQLTPPSFELAILQGMRTSTGVLCLLLRDSLILPMTAMIVLLLSRLILRK